ncbi:MAG: hypothetical protein RXQ62_00440 [Nitrososphaeria archaeon]
MQPGISLRMEAYRRPEARDALSRILREGGAYSTDHPAEILRELSELGILREVARESWMRDPGTGATSFTLRPSCPYCGSFSLGKEDLLEHVGCGYVGRASEFMRDGGCAVCPRCGRPAEVRRIGSWFYCRSCGRSFHSPRIFASSGGKAIPAEDLELVEAARYELAPGIADEVRGVLSLYSSLEGRLRSFGYSVEPARAITGTSGVRHVFDLVALGEGPMVLADVILGESEQMLLANLLGRVIKYLDAPRGSTLLLVLAPRSDLPKQLLRGCCPGSLRTVEGEDPEEAAAALGALDLRANPG